MNDTLTALLLQLSEGGSPALLWGRQAKPHFGPAFDRFLTAGVLVEHPSIEEWSPCPDCDCGFDTRLIQRIDGKVVAACPVDATSDTELQEDDLREFRIDPERREIDRLDQDALEPKTDGPRLSIQVAAQAVLIDGTPQRVPAQHFNLLALLARAVRDGRGPVGNRAIEDTTGRDARDLVRELRDALSAGRPNGSELRDWIEARRSLGAFELVLQCEEIRFAP